LSLVLIPPVFRSCWVCFATDEDDRTAEWVRPCRCRGSTKWVHQSCLQRWVDEKQRGNSTARVACPQCNAEYLIVFPKLVLPPPPQGGIAFVAIKGAFKVYFKQQQYQRQAHRKILDFPEPEEA
ncbi:E3 ubiquitin-protein ligase MARCH5-like, partial [Notothenia coriiceps]|uniref:E3 ubiquitin-protein ligase MARCHF5 n=1 Tax=Notothenia coriiceps TaxID=8208 RepID=A0A6I9MT28_9TELE